MCTPHQVFFELRDCILQCVMSFVSNVWTLKKRIAMYYLRQEMAISHFSAWRQSKRPVPTLRWRHDGRDSVSNHLHHDCLLNRLFRRRSKKTSKLRVTGLWGRGNSPGTGEFPAQMASDAENVSIWWRHHGQGPIWPCYGTCIFAIFACGHVLDMIDFQCRNRRWPCVRID